MEMKRYFYNRTTFNYSNSLQFNYGKLWLISAHRYHAKWYSAVVSRGGSKILESGQ